MMYRRRAVWVALLIGSVLVEGTALGNQTHRHPHYAPIAQPSAPHVGHAHHPPSYGAGPHRGINGKALSRAATSLRKGAGPSRKSGKRGAGSGLRGLRSLPRLAYPTDLRGPTEVDGRFLRPIDGDTFAFNGMKVRLSGLDAPELGTPGGSEAAQHLAAILQEGQVTIVPRSRDIYGRTVADVFMNGQNLADRMIAEGFARRG